MDDTLPEDILVHVKILLAGKWYSDI